MKNQANVQIRVLPALFTVFMFLLPAQDRDDFWKFIHFLLYFFFNVSKALAVVPI